MPRYDKCLNNCGEYVEKLFEEVKSDNNKMLYETLLDILKRNGTYFLNKPSIINLYTATTLLVISHKKSSVHCHE